ncbi:MAG: replicative DNA helicase [Hymenobacter sp.]
MEKAVLCAILTHADGLRQVLTLLKSTEAFYQPAHQLVFAAVRELHRNGGAVDYLSVIEQLRSMGRLEAAGGAEAVQRLASGAAPVSVETHCHKLLEYFTLRQVLAAAQQMMRDVQDRTQAPLAVLAKATRSLSACTDTLSTKQSSTSKALYDPAFTLIEKAMQSNGLTGVPSGLIEIDKLTGGWQKSDLIILAARPGMGKTTLALNIARNAVVDFQIAVAFFSLEMGELQLELKLIAAETQCTSSELLRGRLPFGKTLPVLREESRHLVSDHLHIDDSSSLTISQFRAKAARLVAMFNIGLIVVDYLQLMSGESGGKGGNREQEISTISRGMKQCAKELNVPIIALSQLSRAVEARADKRPGLSDLRESGAIEQDADMVIFPFRPEYYDIEQDAEGNSTKGTAEIIIAKHRNGPVDTVHVRCDMATSRFFSPEPDWAEFGDPLPKATNLPASNFDNEPVVKSNGMPPYERAPF